MEELLTLEGALRWLTGLGAGIIAYLILNRWPWYNTLQDYLAKRLIALLSPAPLAILAFLLLVVVGYEPMPGSPVAWVEAVWVTGIGSIFAYLAYSIAERKRRANGV